MKKKLFAAVVSLVVAVVMLTSASFAWFTVSTTAEASEIKVKMTAFNNLEIAGGTGTIGEVAENDTGKVNTWGSTLPFSGEIELTQMATLDGTTIKTASYGTDGRMSAIVDATKDEDGVYTGATATPTTYKDGSNRLCAAVYDMQLRSNETCNVTATVTGDLNDLSIYVDGTQITTSGGTATISLTANTAKAVQVVVLMEGTTHTAADVATAHTLDVDIAFAKAAAAGGGGT